MNQNCQDVFQDYELPFKTFFSRDVEHLNQTHDETELVWVFSGEATMICDDVKYQLGRQTLFMINANQKHSVISSYDSLIITYRFNREYLEKNNFHFKNMRFINRVYTIGELVEKYREVPLLISQLIKLLIAEKNSFLIRYKIIGYYNILIYELHTLLLKEKSPDVKKKNCKECLSRLNTVIDYVSNNYSRDILLDELAGKIGISRYRLSHFIKEQMGISLRDYVTRIRFDNALKLLRETEMKVLEVSKKSGFSDVKYLNQLLRKNYNTTALKYRKINRSNRISLCIDKVNIEAFLSELRTFLLSVEVAEGNNLRA